MYVDLCIEALDTDDFTYIAHPDVVNFVGDADVYYKHMSRLIEAMKKRNVPAEFNLLGFAANRHYPRVDVFQMIRDASLPVIIGSDAHNPKDCGNQGYAERAASLLNDIGITPIDTLSLIKPKF
jgi:histidinol-phosphatase (PHP family)